MATGRHRWHLESKEVTAFNTHQGNFQWKCMPFGLKVCKITFQRMMNAIFAEISKNVSAYLDDDILCGKDVMSHFNSLDCKL